ncbi:MAG: hypothetical protein LBR32_08695 [Propionibacteriaceae bacterium]|nr:hypothetical protein [Propionibacteriaceae bacterium]
MGDEAAVTTWRADLGWAAAAGVVAQLVGVLVAWGFLWVVSFAVGVGASLRMEQALMVVPGVLCGAAVGWISRRVLWAAVLAAAVTGAGNWLLQRAFPALDLGIAAAMFTACWAGVLIAVGVAVGAALLRRRLGGRPSPIEELPGMGLRQPPVWLKPATGAAALALLAAVAFFVFPMPYAGFRAVYADQTRALVPAAWVPIPIAEGEDWQLAFGDRADDPTFTVRLLGRFDGSVTDAWNTVTMADPAGIGARGCVNSVDGDDSGIGPGPANEGRQVELRDYCWVGEHADGQVWEDVYMAAGWPFRDAALMLISAKSGDLDQSVVDVMKSTLSPPMIRT